MVTRRLLLSTLAIGLGIGPFAAHAASDDLARRLTAPPQEFTQILAGKAPAPMPVSTYVGVQPAAIPATPVIPQSAATALPLAPVLARAADQVATLQVTAAPRDTLGGPAWWRVSDGDSTVWIMGTPDVFPLSVKWDQRALARHMQDARLLIVPGNIGTNVRSADKTQSPPQRPNTSLAERLPPALMDRVLKRADYNLSLGKNQAWRQAYTAKTVGLTDRNGYYSPQYTLDRLSPLLSPLEYTTVQTVAQRLIQPLSLPGYSGNPARAAALQLAARDKALVKVLPFSAAAFTSFRNSISVSEDLQQQCLSHVLDILDQDQTPVSLAESLDAWARGDVQHALKRADPMNSCSYGQVAADFWSRLVAENLSAVREALETPGESVAIVEFDPLLAPGGLIDQLKAAGYAVVSPEGAV